MRRTYRDDALDAGQEHVLVESIGGVFVLPRHVQSTDMAGDGIDELEVHRLYTTRQNVVNHYAYTPR